MIHVELHTSSGPVVVFASEATDEEVAAAAPPGFEVAFEQVLPDQDHPGAYRAPLLPSGASEATTPR